jgi:DMSO reductase anchor subunit
MFNNFNFVLPLGVLLGRAVSMQWQLGTMGFSDASAEMVFRSLYLAPAGINIYLAVNSKVRKQPSCARILWLFAIPMTVAAVLLRSTLHEKDAQGAIFVAMIPFIHFVLIGIACLFSHSSTH